MKRFSLEEVHRHNKPDDCWVVISGKVYDLTKFMSVHPGGSVVLRQSAGTDATEDFYGLHRSDVMDKFGPKLLIGELETHTQEKIDNRASKKSKVPYSEASFWMGWNSPYYTQSHIKFKEAVRSIVERELKPIANKLDDRGKDPSPKLYRKLGELGFIGCRLGPGPHLEGFFIPGGVSWQEFDYFHELILHEELAKLGTPGFFDGIGTGAVIGLPPVINFGTTALKKKVIPEVFLGKKRICLAISEPFAGSDVAGLKTTARKSACGKFYIVNGVKKWITNGTFCDYFTTAVQTSDGKGGSGMSLLLIERGEGVETKKIITSYSPSAGTAYIEFNNVKVPVENLLGKENQGFRVVLTNFNHERWFISIYTLRMARLAVEDCFKWSNQRKIFGKRLIDQPVIRNKIGTMMAEVEAVQAWLELITHQMNTMTPKEQVRHLAGTIALFKFRVTRVALIVQDHSVQIFGGRSITRSGMGKYVEKFSRFVKFGAVYGGSEEILVDLGVRQALKYFPRQARL